MSGKDFLKLNDQIRQLRIERRKGDDTTKWHLCKMYEDLIIGEIESSNEKDKLKQGMKYADIEDLSLFLQAGFEFELKSSDGWHKKKVTIFENLNLNALAKLISDSRIRIEEN